MAQKTNRVMPETDDALICIEIANRVTLDWYQNIFEPPLRKILDTNEKAKIFITYEHPFQGWDLDAAAHDLSMLTEHKDRVGKVALVNPPDAVRQRWMLLGPLCSGEIRFFSKEESGKALEWVRNDNIKPVGKPNYIMPQSEGSVLCINVGHGITLDAYSNFYMPTVCKIFDEYAEIKILYYFSDPKNFVGWEEEAAEMDFKNLVKYGKMAKKIALVDAPEPVRAKWELKKYLLGGEVRLFEEGEFDAALDWIKSA